MLAADGFAANVPWASSFGLSIDACALEYRDSVIVFLEVIKNDFGFASLSSFLVAAVAAVGEVIVYLFLVINYVD